MQFIRSHTVFLLVLLLLRSVKADLRKCADFDPAIDADEFPNQNELEQIQVFFNNTNFDQTEQIFHLLHLIEANEINKINHMSSLKLVQNVVSL